MDEKTVKAIAGLILLVVVIIPAFCATEYGRETCQDVWDTIVFFAIAMVVILALILLWVAYEHGYLDWLLDRL